MFKQTSGKLIVMTFLCKFNGFDNCPCWGVLRIPGGPEQGRTFNTIPDREQVFRDVYLFLQLESLMLVHLMKGICVKQRGMGFLRRAILILSPHSSEASKNTCPAYPSAVPLSPVLWSLYSSPPTHSTDFSKLPSSPQNYKKWDHQPLWCL